MPNDAAEVVQPPSQSLQPLQPASQSLQPASQSLPLDGEADAIPASQSLPLDGEADAIDDDATDVPEEEKRTEMLPIEDCKNFQAQKTRTAST